MGCINTVMNHSAVYDRLIARARTRGKISSCHKHHIVPVSLGGTDNPSNLVHLTYREHFLAHILLVKIYPEGSIERYKMLCALRRLDCDGRFKSRAFSKHYAEFAEILRHRMSGESNPNYGGRLQTDEVKAKMRKPRKNPQNMGKWERTEEYRQAKSSAQKVNSHFVSANPMGSPEMRAKVAASKIGKRIHYNLDAPGARKMFVPGSAPPGWHLPGIG